MDTRDAHKQLIKAQRKKLYASPTDPIRADWDIQEAKSMEAEARSKLTPLEPLKTGLGGEIIPPVALGMPGLELNLKEPDLLDLEATIKRSDLADRAGVFEMAIETAESSKAKGSVQKMLTHQMAAAHKHCMKLIAESEEQADPYFKVKLMNLSVRLMEAYCKGALTLQKLQTGANQIVTVQHVCINGGQAVIGNVGRA